MAKSAWKQTLGMGLLATAVGAACSNPAKKSTEGSSDVAPEIGAKVKPARFVQGSVGFASFSSETVRQAAMEYPVAELAADEAPISLTADDGTGLVLEALDAQAVIEGPLAFTELRMRFRNPLSRTLEGRFQITLPDGASVSRLAMRMSDGWREAEVVERQAARRAYEDFLHRKQDPMLLEKEAGNQFRARIFPIPADGVKEVILSFSHELRAGAGYSLPLRGMPAIDELDVKALVAEKSGKETRYQPHTMSAKGTVPTADFHVDTEPTLLALRHANHVVARVRPELSVKASRATGLTILFDTSASRAPGFAKQVRRLGGLVEAIAAAQGARLHLEVGLFDQEVTPVYSGAAGDFGKKELDTILARRPLGASDLGGALAWAGQREGSDRVLVIGDGVATAGESDLAGQAKALPDAIKRIDVLLVGGIRDQVAAEQLVRNTRSLDGVVLREGLEDAEIARRLGDATASIRFDVPGAKWVWPQSVEGVQPGDEIVVYAGYDRDSSAPATFNLNIAGGRPLPAMQTAKTPGPLLERSAMQARIAALQSDYISELAADKKAAIKARIVELSTQHRVLSDHTALLVLETEADYARFNIDRRALADVLTVGDSGLKLTQRTTLQIAKPEPSKPMKKIADNKDGNFKGAKEKSLESGADQGELDFDDDGDMEQKAEARAEGGEGRGDNMDPGAPPPSPDAEPAPADERSADAPREMARQRPAPRPAQRSASLDDSMSESVATEEESEAPSTGAVEAKKNDGPPALTGKMASIHRDLEAGRSAEAIAEALRWRNEESGNVMALVALGEALEAAGNDGLAARAYGSIIDLFPSRADLRRFASARLGRLEGAGASLSIDSLRKAVEQRPDHLSVHRLLAYALVRDGQYAEAFAAIEAGLGRQYPSSRFAGGRRILEDDMGIIGAAWIARDAKKRSEVLSRLEKSGAKLSEKASTRFVLNWETDANDVDFHIYDGKGGHAYYSDKQLPSGGELYADVTTGYGPECFAIEGKATAFPYNLQIHYYSRGPMGYGMGQVEILQHDGKGELSLDTRPFVVMNDGAYVSLGEITGPL